MRDIRSGTVRAFPAGTQIKWAPSTDQWWRLLTAGALLTTSATVATRYPAFILQNPDGIGVYFSSEGSGATASSTTHWNVSPAYGNSHEGSDGQTQLYSSPWLSEWVPPGYSIVTAVSGFDPGDQWTDLVWLAEFSRSVWRSDQLAVLRREVIDELEAEG